nr:ubiquinol-cytochrome C chaperone family protein [Pectinatus brassicae]
MNGGFFVSGLKILNEFSNDELEVLVKIIIEKGWKSQTLSHDETYKSHHPNHICYVEQIKKELRGFGGNTIVNMFRRGELPYREMLIDVCKKTKTPFNEKASLERIENALLEHVLEESWDKMSDEDKEEILKAGGQKCDVGGFAAGALIAIFRAGGFNSYKLAMIIANSIAKAILGRGLPFVAGAVLGRGLAVFAGPIGLILTGIWAVMDITGPAYSVTVPAIIYIAALRQVHCSEYYKNSSL